MMRGVDDPVVARLRATRGGLTTLARRGGEAMAATARAGFRKRFERQALEQATRQGRTLSPQQLDEAVSALLRAHMLMMVEKRREKRYATDAAETRLRPGLAPDASMPDMSLDALMADAERKALGDDPRDTRALRQVAQPLRLCIGCWLEMCPGEPFPSAASSILCQQHLASYMEMAAPAVEIAAVSPPEAPPKRGKQAKTRNAPVSHHERARGLNHRPVHQSL